MEHRGFDSIRAESLLVRLGIAHTGSPQLKEPRPVQSMPPGQKVSAGAVSALSDVTQPQFEAKTKASDYLLA